MSRKHDLKSLTDDLVKLGISQGDVLFIGADLTKIGIIQGKIKEVILNSLLNAVGKNGTIVTNSFTKAFFLRHIDSDYIFNNDTVPYSGALSRIFLSHPECRRSKHPTNSFVAIGKEADYIVDGHGAEQSSYLPLRKILELKGKQLLIGCVDRMNGVATVHLAQEMLGLSERNLLRNRIGVYYRDGDQVRLFKRKDVGGCSRGFYRFYNDFVASNILLTGYYGDAYSIVTGFQESFEIVSGILRKNPRYALCDDPNCFVCRGTWLYNKRDMPLFYMRNLFRITKRILSKHTENAD